MNLIKSVYPLDDFNNRIIEYAKNEKLVITNKNKADKILAPIGAPVVLNGTRGNMAIAVSITNHNYYKMHRIVMPDGSQFVFKNEKNRAEPSGATSKVDAVTSTTDSVSTNSITNPDEIVKKEKRVVKDFCLEQRQMF